MVRIKYPTLGKNIREKQRKKYDARALKYREMRLVINYNIFVTNRLNKNEGITNHLH